MDISLGDFVSLIGNFGAGTVLLCIVGLAVWGWSMKRDRDYWRDVAVGLLSATERGADALQLVARHVTKDEPK